MNVEKFGFIHKGIKVTIYESDTLQTVESFFKNEPEKDFFKLLVFVKDIFGLPYIKYIEYEKTKICLESINISICREINSENFTEVIKLLNDFLALLLNVSSINQYTTTIYDKNITNNFENYYISTSKLFEITRSFETILDKINYDGRYILNILVIILYTHLLSNKNKLRINVDSIELYGNTIAIRCKERNRITTYYTITLHNSESLYTTLIVYDVENLLSLTRNILETLNIINDVHIITIEPTIVINKPEISKDLEEPKDNDQSNNEIEEHKDEPDKEKQTEKSIKFHRIEYLDI